MLKIEGCGAKAEFKNLSVKLKSQEAKLKDFCYKTDRRVDKFRVHVNGFDKSVSQKAVWAEKKAVAKVSESGIIKITSNAHPRKLEFENIIKKCISQDKPVFADDLVPYFYRIASENNRFIMALHGTSNEVFIHGQKIDEKILANIVRRRKDYNGEEIVLISCNTGNTEHNEICFAQKLANELRVTVYAPTKYGAIYSTGSYFSSNRIGNRREGYFKQFIPK